MQFVRVRLLRWHFYMMDIKKNCIIFHDLFGSHTGLPSFPSNGHLAGSYRRNTTLSHIPKRTSSLLLKITLTSPAI